MRQEVAFVVLFCMLGFSAHAQTDHAGKPVLSQIQKWQLNSYQQFLEESHLNIPRKTALAQFTKALQTCNTSISCARALPVQDLKLEGERLNASLVKLKFSTLGEFNNLGFVIERRYDNSTNRFDSVGFVKSEGNSIGKTKYSFQDNNWYDKYTFYRLRQIDIDGRFKFSKIIKVAGYSSQPSLKVIPNPATSENIFIQLSGFKKQNGIKLIVLDTKGSIVYGRDHLNIFGNNYRLQSIRLASGMYYLRVSNDDGENAYTTLIVQ